MRGINLSYMCLHPKLIPNPNFGRKKTSHYNYLKDCTSSHIPVPCGHCSQCFFRRQMNLAQRVYMESLVKDVYYVTLTYNENVPIVDTPLGSFKYPSYHDVRCFLKRLEKSRLLGDSFSYIFISEYGTKKHRPHFHGLFFLDKFTGVNSRQLNLERQNALFWPVFNEWRRNIGSTRTPVWTPLCTYKYDPRTGKRNYDFQYIHPSTSYTHSSSVTDSVTFYITKYMTKYDKWFEKFLGKLFYNTPEDEFKSISSLIKPHVYCSKTLGLPLSDIQYNHLRKGIDSSIRHAKGYFEFIMPSGQYVPLSRFYRRYVTVNDGQAMYMNTPSEYIDNFLPNDMSPYENRQNAQQIREEEKRFMNIQNILEEKFSKKE